MTSRVRFPANATALMLRPLFWTAWDRGEAITVDVVDVDWDFWGVTEQGLESVRREYGVAPAAPELRP